MSDPATIISAIAGVLVSLIIIFKSFKSCTTPCLTIQLNDDEKINATVLEYVKYKMTPRKPVDNNLNNNISV
jgi:hypothetical protein